MEIETKNASLDTMSVTICALHVSGKQMTLAVFRQLPIAEVFLSDGSLAPLTPWGLVRYDIKNEGAIWLVASLDGRLFRGDVKHNFYSVKLATDSLEHAHDRLADYCLWEDAAIDYANRYASYEAQRTSIAAACPAMSDMQRRDWIRKREPSQPKAPPNHYVAGHKRGEREGFKEHVKIAINRLETAKRAQAATEVL